MPDLYLVCHSSPIRAEKFVIHPSNPIIFIFTPRSHNNPCGWEKCTYLIKINMTTISRPVGPDEHLKKTRPLRCITAQKQPRHHWKPRQQKTHVSTYNVNPRHDNNYISHCCHSIKLYLSPLSCEHPGRAGNHLRFCCKSRTKACQNHTIVLPNNDGSERGLFLRTTRKKYLVGCI